MAAFFNAIMTRKSLLKIPLHFSALPLARSFPMLCDMSLHELVGHHAAKDQILRAVREDRLPQILLLTGGAGVGKQRFALWVAQVVLCENRSAAPCGECQACRLVVGLAHPDLHWFMPVPRPKATDHDRQVEELAETLGEVIEERRHNPLYQPVEGLSGHFVATARLLQRRAALTPAMGHRKVFLLAEADRLVPQESSPEAANALLKLLEEPPANTQFLLTAVDQNRLLPTIRSRVVPLRLGRLPNVEVERFLAEMVGLTESELQRRVSLAGGSIGRAIALGEDERKASSAVEDLLKAAVGGAGTRAERALKQGTWAARGDFTTMLDALAETLGEAARTASGAPGRGQLPESLRTSRPVAAIVEAARRVATAREAAQGNVNPQLLFSTLVDDLAEVL
jgi:DNA polymerase III subunit delta'